MEYLDKNYKPIRTGDLERKKKIMCTLFTRKNNKAVVTCEVDSKDKELLKYVFIIKGFFGNVSFDDKENIKNHIFRGWELTEENKELGKKFNKKFRILINVR